jgi:hypothetical protein
MFQTKVLEKIKTNILCSVTFKENRIFHEIMWKNVIVTDRPQMTMWRMRISCCILKNTNAFSQYIILIAFPLQQCFRGRVSLLRYTSIDCTVVLLPSVCVCLIQMLIQMTEFNGIRDERYVTGGHDKFVCLPDV